MMIKDIILYVNSGGLDQHAHHCSANKDFDVCLDIQDTAEYIKEQ